LITVFQQLQCRDFVFLGLFTTNKSVQAQLAEKGIHLVEIDLLKQGKHKQARIQPHELPDY